MAERFRPFEKDVTESLQFGGLNPARCSLRLCKKFPRLGSKRQGAAGTGPGGPFPASEGRPARLMPRDTGLRPVFTGLRPVATGLRPVPAGTDGRKTGHGDAPHGPSPARPSPRALWSGRSGPDRAYRTIVPRLVGRIVPFFGFSRSRKPGKRIFVQ